MFWVQMDFAGCGINDRDSLTDMTLLHFAAKSGAAGMAHPRDAAALVSHLIPMVENSPILLLFPSTPTGR